MDQNVRHHRGVDFVIGHLYEYAGYEFELKKFTGEISAKFVFTKGGGGYEAGREITLDFMGVWQHKGPGIHIDPKNINGVALLDKEW
jgi:hypothetical protein